MESYKVRIKYSMGKYYYYRIECMSHDENILKKKKILNVNLVATF